MAVVGAATVDVLPSLRGFSQNVRRQMAAPMAQAGREAGQNLTRSTGSAVAATAGSSVVAPMANAGRTAGRQLAQATGAAAASASGAAMAPATRTIRSRMVGAAQTTAAAAGSAFGTMRTSVGNAATGAAAAGSRAFRGLRSSIANSAAASSAAVGGITGSLRSMAGVAAGIAAGIGLIEMGRAAVTSATNVERATAALTGLYGSADQARQMMGRLRDIARASPIDFSAFTAGAESLAYMGIQGDQAVTVLQRIETAMVASGKGGEAFNQVTEAMLAMVNQGKASAEEINRMSQAGFPAWEMLAEHMNMSIEEIRTAVEGGEISIDDMVAAMESGAGPTFQRMIAAQEEGARTLSATWARVKDNIVVSLGEALGGMSQFTPAVERLGELATGGISALPRVFGQIRDTIINSGVALALYRIFGGIRDFLVALGPAVRGFVEGFAAAFGGLLIAISPLGSLLQRIAGWMGENTTVVRILGSVLGILVAGIVAVRIATAAWAAVQWLLNAAMSANPVGIIIAAIVGLVGVIIYAWNNFDWFRNAVLAVWGALVTAFQAIGAAAVWLWTNALQPAFNAIVTAAQAVAAAAVWLWGALQVAFNAIITAAQAVGAAAVWLWTNAIQPAFNAISLGARFLAAIITFVLVVPFVIAMNIIGAVANWLWTAVIQPVFSAIGSFIGWVWNTLIKPYFDAWVWIFQSILAPAITWFWQAVVVPVFNAIGAAIQWVWNTLIKPIWDLIVWYVTVAIPTAFNLFWGVVQMVWNAIGAAIQWVWNTIIKPVWDYMQFQLNALGIFFQWIWTNVIQPAWNALGAGIKWVYDTIILPTWNALRAALGAVGDFFTWVWNNVIKPAWDAMGAGIRWVWDNVIKPAFDLLNEGTRAVGGVFEEVGNWIRDTWERIQGFASKPIKWVIDLVYNNGIVSVWNGIADMFGLGDKKLSPINTEHLIGYAQGGIHEDHRAQIAPGGAWRVWAEPETGGEAYIPLARQKRRRSTGVLAQVANEFGYTLSSPNQLRYFADSGIWRGMWDIIQRPFPGISLNSHYRPGDPGHHGEGRAIDVGYGDWSKHAAVAAWIAQNFPHSLELISAQFRGGLGIDNGQPYHFGEPTTSQHRDHVHWALASLDGGGGPGGILGALFDIGGWIRGLFQRVVDMVVPGEGGFVDMLKAAPGKLVDLVIDGATGLLGSIFSFGGGAAAEGDILGNATIIGQVARAMGLGRHGVVVALATALQESGLRNLNYGDRDSLGLFQQRPSQGWGTPAQILNPAYAAGKFFEALRGVAGWQSMPVTVAAQRVQRSAFPDAYAKHVGRANTIASQIGFDQGGWIPPGTSLVHNGYKKPEAVLTPSESAALLNMTRRGGDSPLIGEYHSHFHGDQDHVKALDHTMYRMRVAKLGGVHSAG